MASLWDYICTSGATTHGGGGGNGHRLGGGSGGVRDPAETIRLFENTWPLLPATGGVGSDAIRVLLEMRPGMPVVTPLADGVVAAGAHRELMTDDVKKVGAASLFCVASSLEG